MRWMVLVFVACNHASAPTPIARKPAEPPPAQEPEKKIKIVTSSEVRLLDPIKFMAGSPSIDPTSNETLDAVAHTLIADPSITLMEVIAYGSDAVPSLQESVAVSRAQAIVSELIKRGVDKRRLQASGEATSPNAGGPLDPTFLILKRGE
jgi:outer membrane protein OmpA-like peptidoglycan-associated protein